MKSKLFVGLANKAPRYAAAFVFVLVWCAGAPLAKAQNFAVSPTSVSLGIPTMASPPATPPSAAEILNIFVTGSGPATISTSVSGPNAPDFVTTLSSQCTGNITPPALCKLNVTFTDSSAIGETPNALETATLTITTNGTPHSIVVPLSGAYGSIKLFFNDIAEAVSVPTAGFPPNGTFYTIQTASPVLSCPATPTASISGTPDGSGYVFVDNYLTLTGSSFTSENNPNVYAILNAASPVGNICTGGVSDSFNGLIQQDCFSSAYRSYATAGGSAGNSPLLNIDPDTFADPNNSVIPPGNALGPAGGVPPIPLSYYNDEEQLVSYFPSGTVNLTITSLDAGYTYGSSSLFLVTNCLYTGSASGNSTGNPLNTSNPASMIQTTSPLPNTPFTFNNWYAFGTGDPGIEPATGTIPNFALVPIPYSTFESLVAGTPSAPAVCMRVAGLVDSTGAPACGGFQVVCQAPNGSISGDNCGISTTRNLLDTIEFSSPDIPGPPWTVANNMVNSCANYLSTLAPPIAGGTCAVGTGPGLLMFADGVDGNLPAPVCPYPSGSSLYGNQCPVNPLTNYQGANNGDGGGGTKSRQSIYVPVVNMPKPWTVAVIPAHLDNWVPASFTAAFASFEGLYLGLSNNPPANGFKPAPPYSVTAGVIPVATGLPDTSLPLNGGMTNYNSNVNQNYPLGEGICTATTPPAFVSNMTFTQTTSGSPLTEGIYYLPLYTTDCAFTEELYYHPTGSQLTDPTANWASFQYLTIGVDTVAPTLTSYAFSSAGKPAASPFKKGQQVTISYSCTDDFSGIGSCGGGPVVCPLAPNAGPLSYTTPQIPVNTSKTGTFTLTVSATDCAGNSSPQTKVQYTVH